jgi:UDP-N-acetylglucosamine 4,6-dehydratase
VGITDLQATRFWWGLEDAVAFVGSVLPRMQGAEIWIPKLASAKVTDLAHAMAPRSALHVIGMRGPEKIHEAMISATEAVSTYELADRYVLLPKQGQWWSPAPPVGAIPVPVGFTYASDGDPLPVSCEALEAPVCVSVS